MKVFVDPQGAVSLSTIGASSARSEGQKQTLFMWYERGKTFPTLGGYRGHWRRIHQPIDLAQLHARGSQCQACGTEFHVRPGLLKHLRRPGCGCLQALLEFEAPLEVEEAQALRDQDLGLVAERAAQGYAADAALAAAIPGGALRFTKWGRLAGGPARGACGPTWCSCHSSPRATASERPDDARVAADLGAADA